MSTPMRWLAVAAALIAGPLMAEGLATAWYGDSRPMPAMFAQQGSGRIDLTPGIEVRGRTTDGRIYTIRTNARGHRQPAPDAPRWLLTGDSMAFGLGVADDETTAARLHPRHPGTLSIAVPGYSVDDALSAAADALEDHPAAGVIVWLNPVDDDRQRIPSRAHARTVVDGHAIHADAPSWLRSLLATPLSRTQVGATALTALGLVRQVRAHGFGQVAWARAEDGGSADFEALGATIAAFAESHPCTPVWALWVPLPGVAVPTRDTPSAIEAPDLPLDDTAARAGFAEGLGPVPLLDLSRAFAGRADAYLPHDTHLSATGHGLVADALAPHLSSAPQRCP